jgi:2-phospho-L-lactate guanylyltransferase
MQAMPDKSWNVHAIVPVKRLSRAKQRLSPLLSGSERADLARAMLCDVLMTLRATPELSDIIVVTGDPMAANLAISFGARVVNDIMEAGVNMAVESGLKSFDSASAALIIPADVPFVKVTDIQAVISKLGQHSVVLAPASSDGGTNALAMRKVDLIAPSFGEDSFARHQALASCNGIDCGIVRAEGLGRDIDVPDDLLFWSGTKVCSETSRRLSELDVVKRLGIAAFPVLGRQI